MKFDDIGYKILLLMSMGALLGGCVSKIIFAPDNQPQGTYESLGYVPERPAPPDIAKIKEDKQHLQQLYRQNKDKLGSS